MSAGSKSSLTVWTSRGASFRSLASDYRIGRDRIFVGNAIDWAPPQRFDVVQIGIDEVPVPRRRELIDRVLRDFVVPGGKFVFRAGRAGDRDETRLQLEGLGLQPDGEIEARSSGYRRVTSHRVAAGAVRLGGPCVSANTTVQATTS